MEVAAAALCPPDGFGDERKNAAFAFTWHLLGDGRYMDVDLSWPEGRGTLVEALLGVIADQASP